jgi:hypothetical protein
MENYNDHDAILFDFEEEGTKQIDSPTIEAGVSHKRTGVHSSKKEKERDKIADKQTN